jgi:hypothetical protein
MRAASPALRTGVRVDVDRRVAEADEQVGIAKAAYYH